MNSTILVATTRRWVSTARLTMALAKTGCIVEAVCPAEHPLAKTGVVTHAHVYRGLIPLASFERAIAETKPDLIVPTDDLAAQHLYQLHRQHRSCGAAGGSICALIERSLGSPESFSVVSSRTGFMQWAGEQGIRLPKTEVIANLEDLKNWKKSIGFPAVLKADATSGGEGVKVVHSLEDAEYAFPRLQFPPLLARAAKWVLLDRDMATLLPRRLIINAQEFVDGREATTLVACWKGTILAALHFEVINKQYTTGPATVIRLIENTEMANSAEKIVDRLNLSGFHGFDFILDANSQGAYLIEINPRATQVGHLTLGPGRDLPAALCGAISGCAVPGALKLTENDTITLFPGEWARNPESIFLRSGYHDVPWEAPDLVRACLRRTAKWKRWYSRQRRLQGWLGARGPRL